MDKELNIIIVGSSVITALAGLYFVIRIWMVWKYVDKDLFKARVFLNNNFMLKNWMYIIFAGAFVAVRRIMEFLELLGIPVKKIGNFYLFDLIGFLVIFFLVLLAYRWYKLIYSTIPPHRKSDK
ncbi:MAG TPA: hypothetical protein VIO11_10190 [Candidatus Methanoperedens sp.]